jgi:hypothetical protein
MDRSEGFSSIGGNFIEFYECFYAYIFLKDGAQRDSIRQLPSSSSEAFIDF